MSDYGLEVFNSAGELVFASNRKTLQILKSGTVSLDWGWDGEYIEFPPVPNRPQIFAQTAGRYNIYADNWPAAFGGGWDVDWYVMTLFVDVFQKNANGLYYRTQIGATNISLYKRELGRYLPGENSGQKFDNIPYVIFF